MTPESSQSSEELLKSKDSPSAAPSSTSGSNVQNQIRVKNVSEINSNEAEANPSSPPKRKLPSWMIMSSQNENTSGNKKRKMRYNQVENDSASSALGETSSTSNSIQENDKPDDSGYKGDEKEMIVPDNYQEAGPAKENAAVDADVEGVEPKHANDETEAAGVDSCAGANAATTSNGQCSTSSIVATVKAEPNDNIEDNDSVGYITPTSARDIKPAVKVEKEEATSSTTRPTCKFGIRCYRQNPIHRIEEAHPGDKDYRRPDFPAPPDGTPACPFGDLCYRRNPVHFQQFSHPPSTDFEQNWKNHKMRLRKRKQQTNDPNSSYSDLDDDYDLDDPFIDNCSEDEFFPSDDDDDDEDSM